MIYIVIMNAIGKNIDFKLSHIELLTYGMLIINWV